MKLRIATITRSRSGQPVRAERSVDTDVVTIGRHAGSTIHLPDPRVALEQATIVRGHDGDWLTHLRGSSAGRVKLRPGQRVDIGPYAIEVEAADDAGLALAIERVHPLPDDIAALHGPLSLAETRLPKRLASWVLALAILAFFLLWPLQQAYEPAARKAWAARGFTSDLAWDPGELAGPHHLLNRRCDACHRQPFERVRDEACGECHRNVDGHARDAARQHALFGAERCATCHTDHKGALALAHPSSAECVSCHGAIDARVPNIDLPLVEDFASKHGEFRVTVWRGPGREPRDFIRVARNDRAQFVERSGLKFPHDVHLRPDLQGPERKEKLDCASCHRLDAAGRLFAPIRMQQHCQRCHSLAFEPLATTREAPHGDTARVVEAIAEFYRSAVLAALPVDPAAVEPLQRSLGAPAPATRARGEQWARRKATDVARDLIEVRACVVCHDVARGKRDGEWTVAPVQLVNHWLPGSRFDHSRHANTKCSECHAMERSKRSEDIALPDLATCRKCHAGSMPAANKVTSPCLLCHDFHLPQRAPMLVEGRRPVGGAVIPVVRPARGSSAP
jgi:hypothetical protein